MASVPSPEERFKETVCDFAAVILEILNDVRSKGFDELDPRLVEIAGTILSKVNNDKLIRGFIVKSHGYWQQIFDRKEEFIIKHSSDIFVDIPLEHVDSVKTLFITEQANGEPYLEDEDKEDIWAFFHSMVKISIKYFDEYPETQLILNNKLNDSFDWRKEARTWSIVTRS